MMIQKSKMMKEKKQKKKVEEEVVKNVTEKRDISNKYNKQTKIAVIIMIVLIVAIFIAHWIIQESKKFDYGGMKFYKEKEGPVLFYKSLLGYVTASGENIPFILKLRNDPRELDNIPIEGAIKLKKEVILSLSPGIANCSDTYITMLDFSRTLKGFSIKASGATTDKNYAKEYNAPLVDCKDAKEKTVIVMKEGNETKITKTEGCYTIEIKDCEIQKSFERFILRFIENSVIVA